MKFAMGTRRNDHFRTKFHRDICRKYVFSGVTAASWAFYSELKVAMNKNIMEKKSMKKTIYSLIAISAGVVAIVLSCEYSRPKSQIPKTFGSAQNSKKVQTIDDIQVSNSISSAESKIAKKTDDRAEVSELEREENASIEADVIEALKGNPDLAQVAEISNVYCDDQQCKILMESVTDTNHDIIMSMASWLKNHPEYGTQFVKDDVPDNPRAALVTLNFNHRETNQQ